MQLVQEDARQFFGLTQKVAVQDHQPLADLAARVHGPPFASARQQFTFMGAQLGRKPHFDDTAVELRQPVDYLVQQPRRPPVCNAERPQCGYFAPPGFGAGTGAAGGFPKNASFSIVTSNCF